MLSRNLYSVGCAFLFSQNEVMLVWRCESKRRGEEKLCFLVTMHHVLKLTTSQLNWESLNLENRVLIGYLHCVLHKSCHTWFLAGNYGNHKNWVASTQQYMYKSKSPEVKSPFRHKSQTCSLMWGNRWHFANILRFNDNRINCCPHPGPHRSSPGYDSPKSEKIISTYNRGVF